MGERRMVGARVEGFQIGEGKDEIDVVRADPGLVRLCSTLRGLGRC